MAVYLEMNKNTHRALTERVMTKHNWKHKRLVTESMTLLVAAENLSPWRPCWISMK